MSKFAKIIFGTITFFALAGILTLPRPTNAPILDNSLPEKALLPNPQRSTLFFAGDIMLGRHVANKINAAKNPFLPFEKTAPKIQSASIAFANLESPISDKPTIKVDEFIFRATPEHAAAIKDAGFDVLSIANNHILNQGYYGLRYTYNFLKSLGLIPTGAKIPEAQGNAAIIEKNGTRFGFLSYSYSTPKDDPYIGSFNDLITLKQDVVSMKEHYADVVIVSMHAGQEYTRQPNAKQVEFAHAAIDAGADLVVGHHPHWIQTIEEYKGKWIFYSLGNFVFDQMWSVDTREGLTATITFTKNEVTKIELDPVIIDDYSTPRWASEAEKSIILKKIHLTSPVLMNNN